MIQQSHCKYTSIFAEYNIFKQTTNIGQHHSRSKVHIERIKKGAILQHNKDIPNPYT